MRLRLPSTTRRRGLLEVGLFAFTLTLPVAAVLRPVLGLGVSHPGAPPVVSDPWPVFGITMVYTGLLSGLLGAVRLPRPTGGRWRKARVELPLFVMLLLAIGAGVLSGHLVAAFWIALHDPAATFDRPVYVVSAFAFATAAMANGSGGYLLCRAAVLAWPAWDRLRRTRLLWALTHAQLVAGLTLATGVAALLTLLAAAAYFTSPYGPPFGPESLPEGTGPAATFLTWLTTRVLAPVTGILGLGLAALVVILPPAALISYLALRRTTRRLEELVTATSALRELGAGTSATPQSKAKRECRAPMRTSLCRSGWMSPSGSTLLPSTGRSRRRRSSVERPGSATGLLRAGWRSWRSAYGVFGSAVCRYLR